MSGSVYGTIFKISTRENPTSGVGVVSRWLSCGLLLNEEDIQKIFRQEKTGAEQIYHSQKRRG